MRWPRGQVSRWAARAGILALVLNALVPIHLGFDLGEALATSHQPANGPESHSLDWRVLAHLIGHDDHDSKSGHPGKDHKKNCPVCSAFGALTGLVAATVPVVSQPVAIAISNVLAVVDDEPTPAPAAAYRSRAPPLA